MILPNIYNYSEQGIIEKDTFLGEKQAASGKRFEKTYIVGSDTCYALSISTFRFNKIFNMEIKKIEFLYHILRNNFPNASEDSLRWLSY